MQLALSAPVLKSLVVAGLALGAGIAAEATSSSCQLHRLSLHAIDQPGALYLTVFRDGDIHVRFDKMRPMRWETRAWVSDGCRWLGTDTLIPRDDRSFDYEYSETLLGCEPGSTPYYKTPRTGVVTVH